MTSDKIIQLRSQDFIIEYFYIQLHKKGKLNINAFNYSFNVSFQQYIIQKNYIFINLKEPITAV